MTALISDTHRHHQRRAFTLAELQVVIALVGIVTALIVPKYGPRFTVQLAIVQNRGHDACLYVNQFSELRGRYPNDLEELRDFLELNQLLMPGEWLDSDVDGDMLIDSGRSQMQFAQEEAEIALHLEFLRAINEDSDEFIAQIMDRQRPGPLLVVSTVDPVKVGYDRYVRIWVYFDVMKCAELDAVERIVALESVAAPMPVDPIDTAALQSVAIMLQSDSDSRQRAREIPTILREPETVEFVHAVFDQNSDGAITLAEFSERSRRFAEAPTDEESTIGQHVTGQFFRVLVNELSLTVADDASEEIIFHIDDAQGDPTELFSYQNLCDHTGLYVVDRKAEDELCRRLRLAEFLEEEDLLLPRDNVLTSEQRLLQRLSGKELLPEAADELIILTEVRKGFGR